MPCRLEHRNARRPQRLKIICRFAGGSDDHDRSSDTLSWCGNHRIKISAGGDDHQHRVRGEALLLPDLELPWFKIDSAIALEAHRIGADQNRVSQSSLQGEDRW